MLSTIYDSSPVQSSVHTRTRVSYLRESIFMNALPSIISLGLALINADKDEGEYIFEMLLEQEENAQYTAFRYHLATHRYILCIYVVR